MKFPVHITANTVSVFIDGKMWQTDSSNTNWDAIKAAINSDETTSDQLIELLSPERLVQAAFSKLTPEDQDVVGVVNGEVWFKGSVVHNVLCDKILRIAADGFDPQVWINFTNKLFQNPSEVARNELYLWLEKANLPITPDGDFLAYKRVRSNYRDIHSNSFDNSVGQTVQMAREEVDPHRDNLCSRGLHFCSKEYLPHFSSSGSSDHVMVVKINPADVVSIPSDYDNTKGRTWRYEVVGEIPLSEIPTTVWPSVSKGYGSYSWDEDDSDGDDNFF